MQDFTDLLIWQRAHQLALAVYSITKYFPAAEQYGLTSQLRRAAASIAANIAEGYGRYSKKEFHKFLIISRG